MTNVFDTLIERGFIEQSSNEEEVRRLLGNPPVTFYIGFDPTADSLHIGHFIPILLMMHLQKAGHRPIALMGCGTTMVGDPSGRSDMRKMMSMEQINENCAVIKKQFSRFLYFDDKDGAIMENNADWLCKLNYVEFLRDYGKMFSVNRMLTAECFKRRMEVGLTFLEFNYMLMQAYDFLELYRRHKAVMQMGGNDQWSNILAGADLIRRVEGADAYALTVKLLLTSTGQKMGKTEKGALWLDRDKVTPYEFYQYWRNIDDADVYNSLSLLTFLPMAEIRELTAQGADINKAKARLAYEVTALVHSADDAARAQTAAAALFGGGGDISNMPTTVLTKDEFGAGMDILSLLLAAKLISGTSEGRRLIADGGVYLNNERVTDIRLKVDETAFDAGHALLRKGKKVYHKVELR
ncbi:MAG: tyrosine--tRNA ligase [Clostridiales bacterium]|nr:tyrosine--tRNA ligase [Clostridiales bacterium]